ncbi:TIR domain-containing protein [Ktedonosporobacter rubrisoli]|uniref:TIR domain-containing protein n=1 Tax=Ktedonosporobacter rubrisoli TaxID=2509675 RepID=A0A4P6K5Z2_KTERU|nr:caspase family protein [Ktedonosporobacter rubrisoli]QBD82976.1 TIR domain-containing protein [Ktedonosporobacter rubrisoli]
MAETLEIYIASAEEDERLLADLLKASKGTLRPLEQQGFISFWHKRDISPGAFIKQEIKKHLQAARLVLLLISPDFNDSEEIQIIMQRHKAGEIHVIPILLRPFDWETAFGELSPLPDNGKAVTLWGNKDSAFLNIARGVKKVVDELIKPAPTSLEESAGNKSRTKRFSESSSLRSLRESPPSFTNGRQATANVLEHPIQARGYDGVVNYWGVIVGVGDYEDINNYAPMPACVTDAKAIAKQLTCCGYDPGHIRLLVDQDTDEDQLVHELTGNYAKASKPTKGNIISTLMTVAERTRPEDLLLFYYSGHGSMEDRESYLVALDGHKNALKHTALSVSTMKEILLQAPAQKKVIILDACRAEIASRNKGMSQSMSPAFIERVFEQAEGLVILTSCGAGENSYVWEEEKCSVFTYFLLEALQGSNADFNGKDRISANDIYKYVYDKVKRWGMNNNLSQYPRMIADGQGDIIVAYSQREPTTSGTITSKDKAQIILPSRAGALSWKDIQVITIQGEQYVFEQSTVRERPTNDDGTTLREARVRHVETNLSLRLKQVHIVGPDGDGMRLQKILKEERQFLVELENEGYRDFPHVFPLIDDITEKDFTFAYILRECPNHKNQ